MNLPFCINPCGEAIGLDPNEISFVFPISKNGMNSFLMDHNILPERFTRNDGSVFYVFTVEVGKNY